MQKSYLLALYEIAENDPDVCLLLADSGSGYESLFLKHLPEQIFDFGIAEENMVAAAAGMASCGKVPFVYTAGAFLSYRSMEFIRDDVCLQRRGVKLIGMGSGLGWSTLGPTHHTTEELGILRAMPHLTVLSPSDPVRTAECVRLAYETDGPVYIRIGMGGEPVIYDGEDLPVRGENRCVRDGSGAVVFATGTILPAVLEAAKMLAAGGVELRVIDVCRLKPFDEAAVLKETEAFDTVLTVEEHSVTGGLGTAVAEVLAREGRALRFHKIGIKEDSFAKGYGSWEEVRMQNDLDATGIAKQIRSGVASRH
ncbi:MAG: transketolase [Lachnospiraceae bacterium]|nr:transketolase [Lachnospiraceae bacterium]